MSLDLLTAVSVNGIITPRRGESSLGLIRELDVPPGLMELQRSLRRRYDAVFLGPGAVRVDNPTLTSHAVPGFSCVRVTVDPQGSLPQDYRFFDGSARTLVGVSAATPPDYLAFLETRGIEAVSCGEEKVDLPAFFAALAARGIDNVLAEGGGGLNRALLEAGLVDNLHLIVMPVVLDGGAVNLFEGTGPLHRLRLTRCERLAGGDFLWLSYEVRRTAPPPGAWSAADTDRPR
jgi:riboflavin-specific deaminase-like protein